MIIYDHLVGGLEHEWISFFPSYWEFHHPNRRSHIFSEGWRKTTNQTITNINDY
jgi:hypothetical protein